MACSSPNRDTSIARTAFSLLLATLASPKVTLSIVGVCRLISILSEQVGLLEGTRDDTLKDKRLSAAKSLSRQLSKN